MPSLGTNPFPQKKDWWKRITRIAANVMIVHPPCILNVSGNCW